MSATSSGEPITPCRKLFTSCQVSFTGRLYAQSRLAREKSGQKERNIIIRGSKMYQSKHGQERLS